MHEAVIKVEFVNEPDKNPDFGSVKADGKYWGVAKNMLSQFEKGKTYTVGYTTTEGKTGKTFYNVKELRSSAAPSVGHNGPPPTSGYANDKDMISALALYNHSFPVFAARSDSNIDRVSMGGFLFECMLAVDWAKVKHKKFWAEKAAPKPPPPPVEPDGPNDEIPF